MKKKYAKTKLIIVAILVMIGLCLTVFTFDIPATAKTFMGFIGAMESSTELDESNKVVFTIESSEETVGNADINKSVETLYDILTSYSKGYSDIKIARAKSDAKEQIIAYVPDTALTSTFFELFASTKKLEVKNSNGDIVITNDNVETSQYTKDASGNYGVYITLDKKGTAALMKYGEDMTYTLGTETATATTYGTGTLFIYTDTIKTSANTAYNSSIALIAGKIPLTVTVETSTIDALTGKNTATLLAIITGVIAICYVVYMILRHKLLGLVSLLSAGIFVVVYCFIIQSISISSLQLNSYLALMLSFAIFALGIEYQISKMENHYAIGKKLPVSINFGYKESLFPLMDLHITTFVIALSVLIMGSRTIRAISINMICGIIISCLLTMVINKYFIKLLCDIYPNKSKVFNFTRKEVTANEI